ncbi:MAG: M20 family metallopeptidase [Clostridia bacterium]|nr:M20 family metallopeptidase [Clostridia bacterium]
MKSKSNRGFEEMENRGTLPAGDAEARSAYLIEKRRALHRCPEVGFELPKTRALIEQWLDEMGVAHTRGYGESSVVGMIGRRADAPVIAVRADMDALPVEEKTGLPFASAHPGHMHACGHDAHMAMLLGAARTLKPLEDALPFRLKLIFQPSEEGAVSGAKMMLDNGVLDDVDYVLCAHVTGDFEAGAAAYARGAVCSACTPIEIQFRGKTSHATIPQMGCDALAMMFKTYSGIQLMLSRQVDPFEPVVCSVGVAGGGEVHNVICDRAHMKISLRTYRQELNDFALARIRLLAGHAAEEMGGTADFEAHMSAPAVVNDDFLVDCLLAAGDRVLGHGQIVERRPLMSSDDFAWFAQAKPSLYYWLGVGSPAWPKTALHNNDFMLDEKALLPGETLLIAMLYEIAESSRAQ